MTRPPLLQIGDFAAATSLTPQTLRYYHAEGLLVPAEVDSDTGYRAYTFDQVNQAVLVVSLRRAGVRIRDIRAVLAAPDLLPEVLAAHRASLHRRRTEEDAALAHAKQVSEGWPTATERSSAAVTLLTRRVPGEPVGPDGVVLPQRVRDAADALQREAGEAGIDTRGPVWCEYVLSTPEDRAKVTTPQGADWTIAIQTRGSGAAAVPPLADAELDESGPRRERLVRLPATPTMVTLAAALDYVTRTSLEQGLIPDLGRYRYILDDDHVQLAVAVEPFDGDRRVEV